MTILTPTTTLAETMAAIPGAKRALFAKYHIGGCNKCAFKPEETLAEMCERNEGISVEEMISHLQASHEADERLLISPTAAQAALALGTARFIDVRLREEHEAVHIPGSQLKTQDLLAVAMASWPKDSTIIIYDHRGTGTALDGAAYFAGHGFTAVKALRGGIDAYALEADASLPRYQVEFE
jgi:rhodanese-related sulfurtransferase